MIFIPRLVDDSNWEPDGVTHQVRFCEGPVTNWRMVQMLWHCRETRQQQRKQTSTCNAGRTRPTHQVLTVTWDGGYQPGMLMGPLQGSSDLLTLEQFFPPGGLEGPPRRSSQGGCLTPLLSLPDCVQTSQSTDRQPWPGPDYLILKICWRSSPRVITWGKTLGGARRATSGICMISSPP